MTQDLDQLSPKGIGGTEMKQLSGSVTSKASDLNAINDHPNKMQLKFRMDHEVSEVGDVIHSTQPNRDRYHQTILDERKVTLIHQA
jgi:hypothetical protein